MRAKNVGRFVLRSVTVICGLPGSEKLKVGAAANTGATPAILFSCGMALIPAVAMFCASV